MKIKILFGAIIFAIFGALMLLQLNSVQALTSTSSDLTPITPPITGPIPSPTPTPDTQDPTVSISYPLYGSYVRKNSIINIQAQATDNIAVSKVEFYVNSNLICTDTTYPYSCSWFVPKRPRITYNLTANAYDTSDNNASHSIVVTSK